mmetsp:Transcript_103602/g.270576  ORF Transcript_103602/g.270576 Transcript_103602/m.270576 type:complete len:351 (-) Transcript_103602:608-1660(-)
MASDPEPRRLGAEAACRDLVRASSRIFFSRARELYLDWILCFMISALTLSRALYVFVTSSLRICHSFFLSMLRASILSSFRRTCSATCSRIAISLRRCRSTLISLFFVRKLSSSRLKSRYLSFFCSCSSSLNSASSCWSRMALRRSSCFLLDSSKIIFCLIIDCTAFLELSSNSSALKASKRSWRSASFRCFSSNSSRLRSSSSRLASAVLCVFPTRSAFFLSTCSWKACLCCSITSVRLRSWALISAFRASCSRKADSLFSCFSASACFLLSISSSWRRCSSFWRRASAAACRCLSSFCLRNSSLAISFSSLKRASFSICFLSSISAFLSEISFMRSAASRCLNSKALS